MRPTLRSHASCASPAAFGRGADQPDYVDRRLGRGGLGAGGVVGELAVEFLVPVDVAAVMGQPLGLCLEFGTTPLDFLSQRVGRGADVTQLGFGLGDVLVELAPFGSLERPELLSLFERVAQAA